MRNLQNRSARNATIVAGLFGILTAFLVLNDDNTELVQGFASRPIVAASLILGIICGLASLGYFLSSMAHMPTTKRDGPLFFGRAVFMTKSLPDWEQHLAESLSRFETRHKIGIFLYVVAVSFVSLGGIWALLDASLGS